MANTPPNPPFSINWDSPQARGLVFWAPFGRVQGDEYDIVQGRQLTNTATVLHVGSPRMNFVPTFNGSSQYYFANLPEVLEEPIGLFIRGNPTNATSSGFALCLGNNGASGFYGLIFAGATAGDPITVQKQNSGGTSGTASTTTSFLAATWQSAMASFDSTTSRSVWLNNGGLATDTTSISAASPDFISIGALKRTTVTNFYNGQLADARVYNRVMTDIDAQIMNDPITQFDLWYPLRRKTWSFGRPASAAARQQTLSLLGVGA